MPPQAVLWARSSAPADRRRGAAGDHAGLLLPGPAFPAPRSGPGRGGGPAGRAGPDAAPGTVGRADPESPARPPPAPVPDSPAWRRQDPGVAAEPGARPTRPAGGRQLHAAASSARPAPAPPAHFPQEMINSGRGAFSWQPAPAQAGGRRRARAPAHSPARSHSHAGPPTLRPPRSAQMFPLGPGAGGPRPTHASPHVLAHPLVHTQRHTCSFFVYGLSQASTHVPHTCLHTCSSPHTRTHPVFTHVLLLFTLPGAHPLTLVPNFHTRSLLLTHASPMLSFTRSHTPARFLDHLTHAFTHALYIQITCIHFHILTHFTQALTVSSGALTRASPHTVHVQWLPCTLGHTYTCSPSHTFSHTLHTSFSDTLVYTSFETQVHTLTHALSHSRYHVHTHVCHTLSLCLHTHMLSLALVGIHRPGCLPSHGTTPGICIFQGLGFFKVKYSFKLQCNKRRVQPLRSRQQLPAQPKVPPGGTSQKRHRGGQGAGGQGETADPEEPLCSLSPKQRRHFTPEPAAIVPSRLQEDKKEAQKPAQCRLMAPQTVREGWALDSSPEVQGGDCRGTCRSTKVLSPVSAQALGQGPGPLIVLDARTGHSTSPRLEVG